MDALRDFFRRHHAVPVTAGRGGDRIDYPAATDAALCGHAAADCAAWDSTLPGYVRLDVRNRLIAIRGECWRRLPRYGVGGVDYTMADQPEGLAPLRRAWYAACVRVGFGPGRPNTHRGSGRTTGGWGDDEPDG